MKKIISLVFVVMVWCAYFPCSVVAQEKSNFMTHEQLKDQVKELPSFFKRYEDSKSQLQNQYLSLSRSNYDPDSELFRQSFTELVLAYSESRKTLNSYTNLWVTFYLINEKPELLIQDGWTQKQIDLSKSWTGKFTEYRDKIRKIDQKTVSVDRIENFMIRINSSLVIIL